MLRVLSIICLTAFLMPLDQAEMLLVHGHRGSRATRRENTIPAFEYAIKHGADVLELDLAVTKDNVLVVSHFPFITADYPSERVCIGPEVAPHTAIHALTMAH